MAPRTGVVAVAAAPEGQTHRAKTPPPASLAAGLGTFQPAFPLADAVED